MQRIVEFTQTLEPTRGQPDKLPATIPVRLGLVDAELGDLPLVSADAAPQELASAVEHMDGGRSFASGKQIFTVASCVACHKFNGAGTEIGRLVSTPAFASANLRPLAVETTTTRSFFSMKRDANWS